jgi:membrane associated rhomboid family serine protease
MSQCLQIALSSYSGKSGQYFPILRAACIHFHRNVHIVLVISLLRSDFQIVAGVGSFE